MTIQVLIETIEEDIDKSKNILKKPGLHETTANYHDGKISASGEILAYLRAMTERRSF